MYSNAPHSCKHYSNRYNLFRITFPQNPNILNSFPNLPKTDLFQVTFVGKDRPNPTQINNLLKARRNVVEKMLIYLRENNWIYKNIQLNNQQLSEIPIDNIPLEMVENFI